MAVYNFSRVFLKVYGSERKDKKYPLRTLRLCERYVFLSHFRLFRLVALNYFGVAIALFFKKTGTNKKSPPIRWAFKEYFFFS